MNCRQVQRHLHEGTADQLPASRAERLRRHLADCSDCRVAQQRALRLQQLLRVKHHETPGAAYFDNFLDEFHQRLAAATAPHHSLWARLTGSWPWPEAFRIRYGFVHALGVTFLLALIWSAIGTTDLPLRSDPYDTPRLTQNELLPVAEPPPLSTPQTIASALPAPGPQPHPPMLDPLPVAVRADFSAPRYVLDRIQATPVSYEVASIHF